MAWIHLDRHMIVAIHQHLVTRIPRYSASHDAHRNTWTLHLRGAQPVSGQKQILKSKLKIADRK